MGDYKMILNDKTFMENDKVWFVGYLDNILYCMDKECSIEMVTILPSNNGERYRANQICIKNEEKIYCLPDKAKDVYI
jgi:hypothetical protein